MSEINRIASEFLREYLQRNPTGYFPRVCCSEHKTDTSYSHEVAEKFVQTVESDRIEVFEPTSVMILRVCQRNLPKFLAGTRKDGKLVWTHQNHLACIFNREDGDTVSKRSDEQGISNLLMPAPEPHR